jgi:regulator of cell morphogenesis and NO signaling
MAMDRLDDIACPIEGLCAVLIERHHGSLRRALPAISDELAALCRESDSTALRDVCVAFASLADQIDAHLAKEQHLLFPAIEALAGAERDGRRPAMPFVTLLHPIRLMEAEHLRIESAIDQLRDLVLEVAEPDCLMTGWRRVLLALAQLDRDVRAHRRAEDDLLFPRALELERRVFL